MWKIARRLVKGIGKILIIFTVCGGIYRSTPKSLGDPSCERKIQFLQNIFDRLVVYLSIFIIILIPFDERPPFLRISTVRKLYYRLLLLLLPWRV